LKSFARNLFSLLSADIVRRLLGFASVAYLARILGAEAFGSINIGFAVLSYGIMVSSMGLAHLGAREIAKGAPDDVVNDFLSLRLVLAGATVAITVSASLLLISDTTTGLVVSVFSLSIFAYALLIEWYFQGKEQMSIMGIGRVTSPALYLLLVVVLVRSPEDILWVAGAGVMGDFFFAAVLLRKFRNEGGSLTFRIRPAVWKSMLTQSLPIAVGSILAQFTVNYPPIALAILESNADVGIFSAASKIVFYLLMVDRVIAPLLLPALTRWQGISPDVLSNRLGETMRWLMLAGMPIAVGGTLLAQPLVALVFGREYLAAADVFRVFIWNFFLTIFNSVYSNAFIALGRYKTYGYMMFASAAMYVIAVTAFTMSFGYMGTAFGIILSEGVTLLILHFQMKKICTLTVPKGLGKVILSSVLMALAVELTSAVNVLLVTLVGAFVYGVCMIAIRAVTTREIINLVRRA